MSLFKEATFSDDAVCCFDYFSVYSNILNFKISLASLVYFMAPIIIFWVGYIIKEESLQISKLNIWVYILLFWELSFIFFFFFTVPGNTMDNWHIYNTAHLISLGHRHLLFKKFLDSQLPLQKGLKSIRIKRLFVVYDLRSFTLKVKVKSLSCVQLCDPVDCSPPGSSGHGRLQARILEWVAISFSRGSSWPRDQTQVYCIAGRRFNLWATREDWKFYSSWWQ